MPALNPAPNTLGLASPALGPWFRHDSAALPTLAVPDANLSVTVPLLINMEWHAPATGTRSYAIATANRPSLLRNLRAADGIPAFSDGSMVILHTLLPEVELRLWTLTQVVPQPDGSALPAANTPSRLRIKSFALEIPNPPTDMNELRKNDLAAEFDTPQKRAEFLGLTLNGTLGNGTPVHELCQPDHDSSVVFRNETGVPLNTASLWCFDHRGRAVDPGSVAAMWSFMSDPDNAALWNNLATETDPNLSRTAATAPAQIVHLVSPNEGALDASIASRLTTSGMTALGGNTVFTIDTNPSVQLSTADELDTVPIPRMAPLPNGPYVPIPVAPSSASGALFAGWTAAAPVFALSRDYLRVAMVDVESYSVGVGRANPAQAEQTTRVAPMQNNAANPVLLTMDAINTAVMTTLAGGASTAMAPVMDTHWGSSIPFASGTATLPDTLDYEVHALAGEGLVDDETSTEQSVLIDVNTPDVLNSDGWVRIWTHARDADTGRRIRLDGGASAFNGNGLARVILPIVDGTSGPTGPDGDPVFISFDVMVTTGGLTSLFMDQRVIRPAVIGESRIDADNLDGSETLFNCEQGAAFTIGNGEWQAGEHILVVSDDLATTAHAQLDTDSLSAADRVAATLSNAVSADDTLITTSPAFTDAPEGSLAVSGGVASRVHRARNKLIDPGTLGAPAPSMHRLEVVTLDAINLLAAVGAGEGREKYHETAPPQLAHLGVPAATEIGAQGLSLAGPSAAALIPLMDERRSQNLVDYFAAVSTPAPTIDPIAGTTMWSAVLETTAHGVTGDAIVRAYVSAAIATHTPGQNWTELKQNIEDVTNQDIDNLIDSATFDNAAAAAGVDRLIRKSAEGVTDFARAVTGTIEQAEDYIYIQTPCIDTDTEGDSLDWIDAIKARWNDRPGLIVMLVVPENHMPRQPKRLNDIRKAGINAALKELADANAERMALVTPVAGPGRPWHLAGSVIVIDDAWLALGSTHFWRRGLTFDSSIAATLFDENVSVGRPAAVRSARMQLMANSLGLTVNLVPDDPEDCLKAMQQLASGSGLGRVKPNVFSPAQNEIEILERSIWNPDGQPGAFSNWFGFFNDLIENGDGGGFSEAIR